ncbi:solute carrier organic anion transporter family member 5A1b [Genypterus blacodes]|uniref:solute carrier organic anion transporter family member 5A1b n=1 Tax=Genypterus blacodes TaxID=154954 RepID=UPI003F75F0E6
MERFGFYPRRLLLLLLASLCCPPASADRKFGCLFEGELCSSYEICVNDGMFGRCHSVPVKEVYTYDVSPSVVQRFRMLLEKLSNRVDYATTSSRTSSTVLWSCQTVSPSPWWERLSWPSYGVLRIHFLEAQELLGKDKFLGGLIKGKSDPYGVIKISNQLFQI